MSLAPKSVPTQTCPTCGTRVTATATKCLVCGTNLTDDQRQAKAPRQQRRQPMGGNIQGARVPEITISLPVLIGLMAIFLITGGGLSFLILRQIAPSAEGGLNNATITLSPSPTLSPTPETPTATWTPQPTATPSIYTVQEGDTCLSIASFFRISVQSIVLENDLAATCLLSVGQELGIPAPTATPTPQASSTLSSGEATIQACQTQDHIVQADETLSLIALSFGVPAEAIQEWNSLSSDIVFTGQFLSIPLCERTVVGIATVTPSPAPPYPAPELLLPSNGAAFTLANDVVTLQWSSVGSLRDNEFYQITIVDITAGDNSRVISVVRDTSFTVPESLRPRTIFPHIFEWRVGPVAQIGVDENGNPSYRSGGPVSVVRVFSWSGDVIEASPTP